ncbi:MAG: hypothetical protein J1E34_01465 [Oscillospiraceae bacterium]|nr:hypothetical protein [Oscillospiraceae bacterium]
MDIKTGIIILGELLFSAALIYLFQQEEKVLEIENRLTKKIKGASLKRQRAREVKKQKKLNKKALYIPLRENNMTAETKAA